MDNEEVVASVTGLVDRVNKLVTVRALKSRYGRLSWKKNPPSFIVGIDIILKSETLSLAASQKWVCWAVSHL